jgi:hypothetical protein
MMLHTYWCISIFVLSIFGLKLKLNSTPCEISFRKIQFLEKEKKESFPSSLFLFWPSSFSLSAERP